MSGVEILMVVSIVMQLAAMVIAMLLINRTKYRALWICCIIGLALLSVERILQLLIFDGSPISDLTMAWVGIVASVSFSVCVVCARLLVYHVDRMTLERRMLENRVMTMVLRTEERSRASFSRELHDGLGPLLSSAKMSLSSLAKAELQERDRRMLQNTTAVIDEAIRSLREISNNLSPHILNNFGLARGIRHFIDRVGDMHDVNINFRTPLRQERFDSNIEVILYRVVCELINNSLKHAKCRNIDVKLELCDDRLVLQYSDDGCGFSPKDMMDCGMGLSNIRSRVSSLNGIIDIRSSAGKGMSAYIVVGIDSAISHLSGNDVELINSGDYDRKKS